MSGVKSVFVFFCLIVVSIDGSRYSRKNSSYYLSILNQNDDVVKATVKPKISTTLASSSTTLTTSSGSTTTKSIIGNLTNRFVRVQAVPFNPNIASGRSSLQDTSTKDPSSKATLLDRYVRPISSSATTESQILVLNDPANELSKNNNFSKASNCTSSLNLSNKESGRSNK